MDQLAPELKMSEPSYQPFDEDQIPFYQDEGKTVRLNVVCGSYLGLNRTSEASL